MVLRDVVRASRYDGDPMIHETHVCRDCGVEITIPYAEPPEHVVVYDTERSPIAALMDLARTAPERCFRCHRTLVKPVFVGQAAYGRICVKKLGLPANQWVKPRSAFAGKGDSQ